MKIDTTHLSGKVVAVALSGGVDSVVLLHSLLSLKDTVGFELKAIHIEHGIRPVDSVEDMQFCISLCDEWNIPLTCKQFEIGQYRHLGDTLEQSARELRYSCFEQLLEEGYCDLIATAHHLADNSETVLMRIFRGTGISGLGGIAPMRDRYVRPLIDVSKEEIISYAKANALSYREDYTNLDTSYTRNFIRQEVLPLIRERYPQVDESIRRLSVSSSQDDEYLVEVSRGLVKSEGEVAFVLYKGAPLPLLKRAIRLAFESIGVRVDIEDRHLSIILDTLRDPRPITLDMPYMTKVSIEGDRLAVYRPTPKDETVLNLSGEGIYHIGGYSVVLTKVESMLVKGALYIDAKYLEGATLRTRRDGDVFTPFGSGRKKLKDYLIDKKIPLRIRDNLPLITLGGEVLVVATHEISDTVKVTENTTTIYRIQIL